MSRTIYMLLSADNISTDISAEPYKTKKEARDAMLSEFEDVKDNMDPEEYPDAEYNIGEETEEDADTASIFTGGEDGDLYYWQIREITIPD